MGLLAVMGPSKKDQRGPSAFFLRSRLKVSSAAQRSSIRRSMDGKSSSSGSGSNADFGFGGA